MRFSGPCIAAERTVHGFIAVWARMPSPAGDTIVADRWDSERSLDLLGPPRPADLMPNMELGGWGRKEAVFDSNKQEDATGNRKHAQSAGASEISARTCPAWGRHTARPRFCHNVRCGMFGKPNFEGQAYGMLCLARSCSQKLFRQEPSQGWKRLLEPEAGPPLPAPSWKRAPALPAPSAGSSYATGRRVVVGQWDGHTEIQRPAAAGPLWCPASFAEPDDSAPPILRSDAQYAKLTDPTSSQSMARLMLAGGLKDPSQTTETSDAHGDGHTTANEASRPSTRTAQRPASAQSEYLESYLSHRVHEGAKRSARKSRSSSPYHCKNISKNLSVSASLTRRKALHMTDVSAPSQEPVATKQNKFPVTGSKPCCSDSLLIYR